MREAISEGYKTALKAGDKRRTATLRAVNAAIKDKDIEARGQGKDPLGEAEVLALLQKMVKQREESLGIYEKAGREDLAGVEREEIAILSEFVPQGLSEAELEAAIKESRASEDIELRRKAFATVQRLVMENAFVAPLAFQFELVAMNKKVQGSRPNLLGKPKYDDVWLES